MTTLLRPALFLTRDSSVASHGIIAPIRHCGFVEHRRARLHKRCLNLNRGIVADWAHLAR